MNSWLENGPLKRCDSLERIGVIRMIDKRTVRQTAESRHRRSRGLYWVRTKRRGPVKGTDTIGFDSLFLNGTNYAKQLFIQFQHGLVTRLHGRRPKRANFFRNLSRLECSRHASDTSESRRKLKNEITQSNGCRKCRSLGVSDLLAARRSTK